LHADEDSLGDALETCGVEVRRQRLCRGTGSGVMRRPQGRQQRATVRRQLAVVGAGVDIAAHGIITRAAERPFVARQIADLRIKVADTAAPVRSLSGGNQQKVVIGNWLNTAPRVMFFDEPSRGVDVNAKQQLFQIIWQKAAEGLAVIFVSSELEELLEVCDRILVMKEGRLVGTRDPARTSLSELYAACMGEAA